MFTREGNQGAFSRTLYNVQDEVFFKRERLYEPPDRTVTQLKEFVERVHSSPLVREKYPAFAAMPLPEITLRSSQFLDNTTGYVESARTNVRTRAMEFSSSRESTSDDSILHELAHVIQIDVLGGYNGVRLATAYGYDPHGIQYARTLAFLFDNFITDKSKAEEFRRLLSLQGAEV